MGMMSLYSGGGYVYELRKDVSQMQQQLQQLQNEEWVDKYTRAVFIEFTVYNPQINLFGVSTLLAEFRPSGGVFTSYRFEPTMLLPYVTDVFLFQIACEIIYFSFCFYFLVKLIRALVKEKWSYFKQFWNLIELGICAVSVGAIVVYFSKLIMVNGLTSYFKETHGNSYMKFQYIGYWSEMYSYMIGWLVFLATMKFLKLLRFNKRISLLASTLKNASKDLLHFGIVFNIVYLAFIQLFYLTFVANIVDFKVNKCVYCPAYHCNIILYVDTHSILYYISL
jgi:polycystin 1L2